MTPEDSEAKGVRARVIVIDPTTMTVLWMNEPPARQPGEVAATEVPAPLAEVVPMAEMLGVVEAIHTVARTGEPKHLETRLVSTNRGSVSLATSLYRLPDGRVLAVTENAWTHARPGLTAPRRVR